MEQTRQGPTWPKQEPGVSANEYLALLPRRRHPSSARGLVLFLPRTGVIVVPHSRQFSGWTVTVVGGSSGTYRPGGYDLFVGDREITTAIKVGVDNAPLVDEPEVPESKWPWARPGGRRTEEA